ncbi:MAG: hypothetical protein AAGB12_12845 [Pseudomonadota bacterium]
MKIYAILLSSFLILLYVFFNNESLTNNDNQVSDVLDNDVHDEKVTMTKDNHVQEPNPTSTTLVDTSSHDTYHDIHENAQDVALDMDEAFNAELMYVHELQDKFNQYFEWLVTQPTNDEEKTDFIQSLLYSLETSPDMQAALIELYSEIPYDMLSKRHALEEILLSTQVGVDVLIEGAEHIFENERSELYPSMFQTLANLSDAINYSVYEEAIAFITHEDRNLVPAMNYIINSGVHSSIPELYRGQTLDALQGVMLNSDNDTEQSVALTTSFLLSLPDESSMIAYDELTRAPSTQKIQRTLSAIARGEISPSQELEDLLNRLQKEQSS